jgi:hypothetical protein
VRKDGSGGENRLSEVAEAVHTRREGADQETASALRTLPGRVRHF